MGKFKQWIRDHIEHTSDSLAVTFIFTGALFIVTVVQGITYNHQYESLVDVVQERNELKEELTTVKKAYSNLLQSYDNQPK